MWINKLLIIQRIIGVIIYRVKEKRARMNSSSPKIKKGILDKILNNNTIYLFFIMLIVTASLSNFMVINKDKSITGIID